MVLLVTLQGTTITNLYDFTTQLVINIIIIIDIIIVIIIIIITNNMYEIFVIVCSPFLLNVAKVAS